MSSMSVPLVPGNIYGPEYVLMSEHGHWSSYDMELEGCRFNRLQVLYGETRTSGRDQDIHKVIHHLVLLAHVKGWLEQDVCPAYDHEHDDYNAILDHSYIEAIDNSLVILSEAGCPLTETNTIRARMMGGIKEGRMSRNGDIAVQSSPRLF